MEITNEKEQPWYSRKQPTSYVSRRLRTGLDPPLLLYYPRLIIRTFLRLVGLAEPCSPGCFESFSDVFLSRDSIVWWTIRYHWEDRRRNQAKLDKVNLEDRRTVSHSRMRRIGGWGHDLKEWLRSVENLVLQPKRQH